MTADIMSVDVGSMPPWKKELLVRKRRQEEEERRRNEEESQRMSHMPAWKRELMLKKKRNVVFVSTSHNSNDDAYIDKDKSFETMAPSVKTELPTINGSLPLVDNHMTVTVVSSPTRPGSTGGAHVATTEWDTSVTGVDVVDNGEVDEHLLPIHYNPWLKSDIQKKRVSRHSYRKSNDFDMANDSNLAQPDDNCQVISGTSPSQNNYLDADIRLSVQDQTPVKNDDTDSVFGEEEVTYGRGFVHKLLRRFKHMSARDEYHISLNRKGSPKRTYSSEDILDDRSLRKSSPRNHLSTGDIYEGYSSLSHQKALSVDSLISRTTKSGSFDSSSNHSHLSASSEENLLDEPPRPMSPEIVNVEIVNDVSPGSLLYRSNSQDNVLEEFPRSNIVSTARSVFESISVRGSSPERHSSPERQKVRTSIISSTSSSASVTSPQSIHSSSILSTDSALPDTERSLSPIPITRYRDRSLSPIPVHNQSVDKAAESTKSSESSESKRRSWDPVPVRPNRRSYMGAKKPEFSPKPSATVNVLNKERNTVEDFNANHAGREEDVDDNDSGVTLLSQRPIDTSVYMPHSTEYRAPTTVFSSLGTGVSASSNVPKTQEKLDHHTVRDHATRHNPPVADHKIIAHYDRTNSREETAVSEEITLDNQSAKDALSNSKTADHLNDIHNRYSSDKISITKNSTAEREVKDSSTINAEHRNPEANRLNLNLNLNELNRKKTVTEPGTDINRNNKSGHKSSTTAVTTNGSVDSFPLRPLRSKKKRRTPDGPGSLLVRPASNLFAAGTKTEYLQLNQYNDIKEGQFAPARKRPSHYDEDSDDEYVPVTNIDDYLPVTNIDDVSPAGTPREGDPTKQRRAVKRYEFVGAGVIVDRSLLTKTRYKKVSSLNLEQIIIKFYLIFCFHNDLQ